MVLHPKNKKALKFLHPKSKRILKSSSEKYKGVRNHERAAHHHEKAAKHHREAAEHHKDGNNKKACESIRSSLHCKRTRTRRYKTSRWKVLKVEISGTLNNK
jgi:hypothetical protein